jgi:hypothetical protein
MGQIAESILRQNQIEEDEEKDKFNKIDKNVSTIRLAAATTTCSTLDNSKISNSSTSSG